MTVDDPFAHLHDEAYAAAFSRGWVGADTLLDPAGRAGASLDGVNITGYGTHKLGDITVSEIATGLRNVFAELLKKVANFLTGGLGDDIGENPGRWRRDWDATAQSGHPRPSADGRTHPDGET
jgi:hypothetical protein